MANSIEHSELILCAVLSHSMLLIFLGGTSGTAKPVNMSSSGVLDSRSARNNAEVSRLNHIQNMSSDEV